MAMRDSFVISRKVLSKDAYYAIPNDFALLICLRWKVRFAARFLKNCTEIICSSLFSAIKIDQIIAKSYINDCFLNPNGEQEAIDKISNSIRFPCTGRFFRLLPRVFGRLNFSWRFLLWWNNFVLRILLHRPQRSSQTFLLRGKTVVERMRFYWIVPEQDVIVNIGQ